MAEVVKQEGAEEEKPSAWFHVWTKEFQLGDGGDTNLQRWRAISSYAANAELSDVEPLTRLSIGSRHQPTADWFRALEEAFRESYPAFTASTSAREMQVLAACCLFAMAEDTGNECDNAAALALSTSAVSGLRKISLPIDLPSVANGALRDLYVASSSRPKLSAGSQYKSLFETAVQKAKSQPDVPTLIEALTLAGGVVTTAVNQNQAKSQAAFEAIAHRLDQQDEELQMLWWLIGERSEQLDCSFGDIADAARPLVLANELAEHTLLPPGPPTIRALLSRAKMPSKGKVAIVDAVAAAPMDWLKAHVAPQGASPVSQPLHLAIERQLETGSGKAWVAGWAAATDLPADASLPHLALAELFYRERLLTRALG